MREFAILEATCRHGRLVITDESVALRPVASLHWRRHHWQVPREAVTGVSSYRGPYGRDLLIHTSDGRSLRADWVKPGQALPITQMFGHTAMANVAVRGRATQAPRAHRPRTSYRVRQGKLVVTETDVGIKRRFSLGRRYRWRVPRAHVTGMLTTRRAGARLRYDLTILTTEGGRLLASDVAPNHVIALTRQLGHTIEVPAMPLPVREDHVALSLALPRLRAAGPVGRWSTEDGGVWVLKPAPGRRPAFGWGSRIGVRERTVSSRFATVAAVTLLCVYVTAALMGGRAMAVGASFAHHIAVPYIGPSHAAPAHAADPIVGSLTLPVTGAAATPTATGHRP